MERNEELMKLWNDMINEIEGDYDMSQLPRYNVVMYYLGYIQCLFNNGIITPNEYKSFMYQVSLID